MEKELRLAMTHESMNTEREFCLPVTHENMHALDMTSSDID